MPVTSRGTAQAVVDRKAQSRFRNGHDRDAADLRPVERAQHGEQVGRRLGQLAGGAEIERDPGAGRHVAPERQQAFVCGDGGRAQPHQSRRCVMALELARRLAGGVARRNGVAQRDRTDHRLDRLARRSTGTQQGRRRGREVEYRQFEPDCARAAIEDHLHPIAQRFGHVLGAGRADGAAAIGRGRGERPADGAHQRLRHRMRRRAHRHRVEPRRRQQGDGRILCARQHQGERSRPEARGELVGRPVPAHQAFRFVGSGHVADQRIELRPSLGFEDGGDGAFVGGVAAQAVDGLGREGDQPALENEARGLGDAHRSALLRAMKCGLEKLGLP